MAKMSSDSKVFWQKTVQIANALNKETEDLQRFGVNLFGFVSGLVKSREHQLKWRIELDPSPRCFVHCFALITSSATQHVSCNSWNCRQKPHSEWTASSAKFVPASPLITCGFSERRVLLLLLGYWTYWYMAMKALLGRCIHCGQPQTSPKKRLNFVQQLKRNF